MTGVSDVDWIAKKLYVSGLDKNALMSANALLAHVTHETSFATNKGIEIAAPKANGQGLGSTNATAYDARGGNTGVSFTVTQRKLRHYGSLTADVVQNAENGGDATQFASAVATDVDGATEGFGQEINIELYRKNLGFRSYATFSGAVATLTDAAGNVTPEATTLFEIGMLLQTVDPASTSAVRTAGSGSAGLSVIAVDTFAGTVTVGANWSTITGTTNLDGIVRRSRLNSTLDGLDGWAPVTPSASFLGVDQTAMPGRLCGSYVDISSYGVREGFIRGFSKFKQQLGNRFDSKAPIFMNPADLAEIKSSVEAIRVIDAPIATKYDISVDAVMINGYTIAEDRHCPVGHAYLVPRKAFTLGTSGDFAVLETLGDGKRFHYNRQTGDIEFTLLMLGNSYSKAVASLGHLKLATRTL